MRNKRLYDGIDRWAYSLSTPATVAAASTINDERTATPTPKPSEHSAGELAVARAAGRAGIPYTLSTLSTRSIEEVAAVADGELWFQVYAWRDRGLLAAMVGRAKAAGYRVLVLTVDTAVLGRRERDVRRGFTLPPKIGLETIIDGMLHPGWT